MRGIKFRIGVEDLYNPEKYCQTAGQKVSDLQGSTLTCTESQVLTEAKRDYLINTLLPKATSALSSALRTMPASYSVTQSQLKYICEYFTASADLGQVTDGDFILLVAAAPTAGSVAWATYCLNNQDGKPTVGVINISPAYIGPAASSWRAVMHEIMHALGFMQLGGDQVQMRGKSVNLVTSPKVKAKAAEHYGCPDLEGMEVDDDGGAGTKGSHWKSRTAKDDLMAGYIGEVMFLSPITLAFMEETGFYTPDYNQANILPYGHGAGCNFVRQPCISGGVSAYPQYFPTAYTKQLCASDYGAVGQMQIRSVECPDLYNYFGDGMCASEARMDFCPYYMPLQVCSVSDTEWSTRCFNKFDESGAACLPISCNFDAQTYTVGGATCTPGESVTVDAASYKCLHFYEACPYRMTGDPVKSCTPDCKTCNNGVCEACNDPYVLSASKTCELPTPDCTPNCKTCNNGVCEACNDPYVLSASKTCQLPTPTCTPNCKTCNNGVCEACNDPYVLSASKTCELPTPDCTPNCKTCNNGVCEACNDPYVLSASKTCELPTPDCTPNCKTCNNGVCEACNDPYVLSASKTCQLPTPTCTPNCKTCNNGVCEACNDPYVLSASKTCDYPSGTCTTNCKTCNNNVCTQCEDAYMITSESSLCVSKIESCVSASDDGKCTSCDGSRKPSEDGSKCVSKGIPWWVWLIIGIVGAVVVLAIIISAICCCCCSDTNLYGESKSSHSSRSSSRSSRGFDDSYSDSYSGSYSSSCTGSYSGSSSRSSSRSSSSSSWRTGSSSGRYY
ncbi:Leishmanolysin, putative [Angomonas deanei]|uniref:Leishmanolysin-like peptidase n=1 Tax=Angomonas deanei TaxID=59799 RepID=A0A7G2CSU1_9TRYP|nr:Leishmanolysin, putative [Angomonas deanei]